MSTILKALRRLENDDPKKKRTGAPPVLRDAPTAAPLPPTDPRAADALRGRILAEEAAARVVSNLRDEAEPKSSRVRPLLLRTLAAVAVLAALLFALTKTGLFSDSEPDTESPVATAEPMPPVAPASVARPSALPSTPPAPPRAMVAVPEALEPADPAPAALPPVPASVVTAAAPIAAAAPPSNAVASPSQNAEIARAVPAAQATPSAPPTMPPTSTTSAMPTPPPTQPTQSARVTPTAPPTPAPTVAAPPVLAPPTRAAAPVPIPVAAPVARPTPTDVAARRPAEGVPSDATSSPPAPSSRALPPEPVPSADVKRVAPAGLPEITVVRTAWHPKPERRSAKVRIVETDELVTVREGDEVEGLVLQEITPSAVVFSAGDVEIRRRVGEASASR
jgi:hypothetical protein